MQCACAILLSVTYSAQQYFPTLSHKQQDFRGKDFVYKIRVLIFSTDFVFFILRQPEPDRSKIHIFLYVNYPLFLSDFKGT